jgi:hypothetical protein
LAGIGGLGDKKQGKKSPNRLIPAQSDWKEFFWTSIAGLINRKSKI